MSDWFAVDLDGTLAEFGEWVGPTHIRKPIAPMVDRVKRWLAEGKDVRIFTARVSAAALIVGGGDEPLDVQTVSDQIADWCEEHIGQRLPVTCVKDYSMAVLYDDRAIQVETNTGRLIGGSE